MDDFAAWMSTVQVVRRVLKLKIGKYHGGAGGKWHFGRRGSATALSLSILQSVCVPLSSRRVFDMHAALDRSRDEAGTRRLVQTCVVSSGGPIVARVCV